MSLEDIVRKLCKNDFNTFLGEMYKNGKYNCWGFTAFILGWNSRLEWLDEDEIEYFIEEYTVPIAKEELKPSDVLVYRYFDGIISHTAVMVDPDSGIFVHKPGSMTLELQNIEGTIGEVDYGKVSEYRRPL